jgi:hypothetical protein
MTGYHSRSLLDLAPPDLRPHLEHDDRRSGADIARSTYVSHSTA